MNWKSVRLVSNHPDGRTMQEITQNKVALILGSAAIIQTWKETQMAVNTECFSLKTEGLGMKPPTLEFPSEQLGAWSGGGAPPSIFQ